MLCLIFRVTAVNKVENVLHARDSCLAGLLNCVEHVFPIRVAIVQEISKPFKPNCDFGNVVVVLDGFLDVLHVDGHQQVRVVEVENFRFHSIELLVLVFALAIL